MNTFIILLMVEMLLFILNFVIIDVSNFIIAFKEQKLAYKELGELVAQHYLNDMDDEEMLRKMNAIWKKHQDNFVDYDRTSMFVIYAILRYLSLPLNILFERVCSNQYHLILCEIFLDSRLFTKIEFV
jgi:hypothetical protein